MKELKKVNAENCVSVILNTHRTSPDNQKDAITLKNLIKNAEERLLKSLDKKKAHEIVEKLKELESSIDHSHNLESLLLFVNVEEKVVEYVRLPIRVVDRVIIGDSFSTRDLIRAQHQSAGYYVLMLSQQNIRLIEAQDDQVIQEFGDPFPLENTGFKTNEGRESSYSALQTNLIADFFNQVDKEVNKIRKDHKLPVLICTEEENYYEYLKIADEKDSIYDEYLKGNRLEEKAGAIVKEAWPMVKNIITKRNENRIKNLEQALSAGNYLSAANEIMIALKEGKIHTLFVEEDLLQPAVMENGSISLLAEHDEKPTGAIDDIFDDMIEMNQEKGGEVVFLPKGLLDKFNGFAAITRY